MGRQARGKDCQVMTKFGLVSVVIPVLNQSACLVQLHAELRVLIVAPLTVRVRLRGRWEHQRHRARPAPVERSRRAGAVPRLVEELGSSAALTARG